MRFDTHLASGVLVAVTAGVYLPSPLNYYVAMGGVIGSVLPDSDIANPGKTLARRLGKKRWGMLEGLFLVATLALRVLALVLGYALFFIASVFRIKHRKEFHSPLFPIGLVTVGLMLSYLSPEFGILMGLGFGWFMHLLMDSFTPTGIWWGKYKLSGPVVTGSLTDSAVRIVLYLISLLVLFIGI